MKGMANMMAKRIRTELPKNMTDVSKNDSVNLSKSNFTEDRSNFIADKSVYKNAYKNAYKNDLVKAAEKIIIIDLLYLGDLLFATPFIRNLRKNYPQARIDMVVNANFSEIMEGNPYLDHIYPYNKGWSFLQSRQFARGLSKNNYDLGINLHGNWRTALLLKIINPAYSIGYGSRGRGIFLNREIKQTEGKHMVEAYLEDFSAVLGFTEIDDRGMEIGVNEEAEKRMRNFLEDQGIKPGDRVVGLNTGGSWPTKRWTKEGFARLADKLQRDYRVKVVFLGGPNDLSRVEEIRGMMETESLVAAGKTGLKELAALTKELDLVISGDTGPVHVAASVGTPTITIFGPSDEKRYAPYGQNNHVIKLNLDCRPCGKHECPRKDSPHECMTGITAEDVLGKILDSGWL